MFEHAHTYPAPLDDPELHIMTRNDGRMTCSRGDWTGGDLGQWWDHIREIGHAQRVHALAARKHS